MRLSQGSCSNSFDWEHGRRECATVGVRGCACARVRRAIRTCSRQPSLRRRGATCSTSVRHEKIHTQARRRTCAQIKANTLARIRVRARMHAQTLTRTHTLAFAHTLARSLAHWLTHPRRRRDVHGVRLVQRGDPYQVLTGIMQRLHVHARAHSRKHRQRAHTHARNVRATEHP